MCKTSFPKIRPDCKKILATGRLAPISDLPDGLLFVTEGGFMPKFASYSNASPLPGFPDSHCGKTYAAWPLWKDSTTKEARFNPLPKTQAARIWHKARRFDRQTRQHGKHGGAIGRTALNVLYALLFEFLDYRTGRLDPSYEGIARKAGVCRRAVAAALSRLKTLGVLNWLRRCTEECDAAGRFQLKQDTNAYAILPPSQWRGFIEPPEPEIDPTAWGAMPPLPSVIEQARSAQQKGDGIKTVLARLDDDPSNRAAAALAALGRTLFALQRQ
jgi:hypothetical protein